MKKRILLSIALFVTFGSFSWAQEYHVSTKADSTNLLIGDYFTVSLSVKAPKGEIILSPSIDQDFFTPYGLEWLFNSPVDTMSEGSSMNYRRTIVVSAYDEGEYVFPSIPIFSPDSLLLAQSQSIPFSVATIPVDTLLGFKDVKNIQKEPLTAKEIVPYILLTWLAILILVLIILLILKYKKKKPALPKKKLPPKEKPDIAALAALDKLWYKKLWQEGKVKPYYSELTEILRMYIEGNFGVNAMEMVSNDILEELNKGELSADAFEKLKEVLYTADMVKFARWNPTPDLHARCFDDAKDFVHLTKVLENTKSSKGESAISDGQNTTIMENEENRK